MINATKTENRDPVAHIASRALTRHTAHGTPSRTYTTAHSRGERVHEHVSSKCFRIFSYENTIVHWRVSARMKSVQGHVSRVNAAHLQVFAAVRHHFPLLLRRTMPRERAPLPIIAHHCVPLRLQRAGEVEHADVPAHTTSHRSLVSSLTCLYDLYSMYHTEQKFFI